MVLVEHWSGTEVLRLRGSGNTHQPGSIQESMCQEASINNVCTWQDGMVLQQSKAAAGRTGRLMFASSAATNNPSYGLGKEHGHSHVQGGCRGLHQQGQEPSKRPWVTRFTDQAPRSIQPTAITHRSWGIKSTYSFARHPPMLCGPARYDNRNPECKDAEARAMPEGGHRAGHWLCKTTG